METHSQKTSQIESKDRFRSAIDVYVGWRELRALWSIVRESNQTIPQKFWEKRHREIIDCLKEKYQLTDKADIEILIPIHKNAADLPLLLWGLAHQSVEGLGSVQLTVVMHNNSEHPEWDMKQDGSWRYVGELIANNVPIRVLTLADPLLTGPYLSWQYGLQQSQGKITAVIDADSVPTQSWIKRITAPLRKDNAVQFTGGVRELFGTTELIRALSRAYYLATTIKSVFDKSGGPHLPNSGRFAGGQAAYRTDCVQTIIGNWYGLPQGDGTLAAQLVREHGNRSFVFVDAPVLNRADGHRNQSKLLRKVGLAAHVVVPDQLRRWLPQQESEAEVHLSTLMRYCPWAQQILNEFFINKKIDSEKAKELMIITAEEQHFENNPYFIEFMINYRFEDIESSKKMLSLIFDFAKSCIRPTMLSYQPKTG